MYVDYVYSGPRLVDGIQAREETSDCVMCVLALNSMSIAYSKALEFTTFSLVPTFSPCQLLYFF